MKRSISILSVAAVVVTFMSFTSSGVFAAEKAAAPLKVSSTLDNLQAAYNGESNARVRYLAFADKADSEGFIKIAALFRAAAKSEEIHAANHVKVIQDMKAVPEAGIEAPAVGTTKQNLEAAVKGETYERDTMYPQFLEKANADKNKAAIRTFTLAKDVEATHACLYSEALQNQADWKTANVIYYDCKVCGNTVVKVDFQRCPVCRESAKDYFPVQM